MLIRFSHTLIYTDFKLIYMSYLIVNLYEYSINKLEEFFKPF